MENKAPSSEPVVQHGYNKESRYENKNNNNNNSSNENKFRNRKKKKVCLICADKNFKIDFKESVKLRKFISDRAKILPRRVTGMCSKHQRVLTIAIKRARFLALLPYCLD